MEETKKILFETCKQLLKSQTIAEISVTDIVKKANVSRPTFYHYFKDKYDIANSLLDYMMIPVIEEFKSTRDFAPYFRKSCMMIHDEYPVLRNIYINSDDQNSFQSYLIESNIKSFESALNINRLTEEQRFQLYVFTYGATMVNWKAVAGEIKIDYSKVIEYSLNNIPDFLKTVLQID